MSNRLGGSRALSPYPNRPVLDVLPEFKNTNSPSIRGPQQRARLLAFVAQQYQEGRSLRELAELTGRSQAAVRRALDQAGVARRPAGAPKQALQPQHK